MCVFNIKKIGTVRSQFAEPADPFIMREYESEIIIDARYKEGLYKLDDSEYIQVVFNFHLNNDYSLQTRTYSSKIKGVFASRSPHRPSSIGVTTVKVLEINDNVLKVKGLDAIDGSPVLDIKPYARSMDEKEIAKVDRQKMKQSPRWEMTKLIRTENLEELLLKIGELHGHYCVGLALGVIAGQKLMMQMTKITRETDNLTAIVEVKNCFVDGIQYVTSCTVGKNNLKIEDKFNNMACTLVQSETNIQLRAVLKEKYLELVETKLPDVYDFIKNRIKPETEEEREEMRKKSTNAAFEILALKEELFEIKEIKKKH